MTRTVLLLAAYFLSILLATLALVLLLGCGSSKSQPDIQSADQKSPDWGWDGGNGRHTE